MGYVTQVPEGVWSICYTRLYNHYSVIAMVLGFFCFISQCKSCQTIQSYQAVRSTPITAVPQVLNKTPALWSSSIPICSYFTAATFGVVFSTRYFFNARDIHCPYKVWYRLDSIFLIKLGGVTIHQPQSFC